MDGTPNLAEQSLNLGQKRVLLPRLLVCIPHGIKHEGAARPLHKPHCPGDLAAPTGLSFASRGVHAVDAHHWPRERVTLPIGPVPPTAAGPPRLLTEELIMLLLSPSPSGFRKGGVATGWAPRVYQAGSRETRSFWAGVWALNPNPSLAAACGLGAPPCTVRRARTHGGANP